MIRNRDSKQEIRDGLMFEGVMEKLLLQRLTVILNSMATIDEMRIYLVGRLRPRRIKRCSPAELLEQVDRTIGNRERKMGLYSLGTGKVV